MSTQVSIGFQLPMMLPSSSEQRMGTEALIPVQVRRALDESVNANPSRGSSSTTALVPLRGGTRSLDLDPGTYHLRATLPNGDSISETVEVTATASQQTITLHAPYSAPNENSGWAYLLNETRREVSRQADLLTDAAHQIKSVAVGRAKDFASDSRNLSDPKDKIGAYIIRGKSLTLDHSNKNIPPDVIFWKEDKGTWTRDPATDWDQHPHPYNDPDALVRWKGPVPVTTRLWLQLENHRGGTFSKFALLCPSRTGEPTRILLQLDAIDARDTDPINIIQETGSEAAAVLLAYLHRGDNESARAVGTDLTSRARQLIQGKFDDFTSAIIAAYFTHQFGYTEGTDHTWWPNWLRNLDEAFPAYSDGTVIHAWHLLSQHQTDSDSDSPNSGETSPDSIKASPNTEASANSSEASGNLTDASHAPITTSPDLAEASANSIATSPFLIEACARLIEAADRGLPLFTRGVRMLLDGLELAVAYFPHDETLKSAATQIRRQAVTLDWTEVTTTRWGKIEATTFTPATRTTP
ncbi:hypothetical protein [Luteolibacter soli]|uniref:Uncharacterized protein n=1 Tax=Luteolibacter soli TaxID=3135280 RepID=A0ABU9AX70_9BACT